MSVTAGMLIATRVVLLTKAEMPPSGKRRRARMPVDDRAPRNRRATMGCMIPATSTARATIRRLAIMIGASLLKPANACCGVITPTSSRVSVATSTAGAGGARSVNSTVTRAASTSTVIQAPASISRPPVRPASG